MEPTNFPADGISLDLFHGYHIPNAGAPMSQKGKDEHEQGEDDVAVLRVAIHLL